MRGEFNDVQNVIDIRRQSNGGSGEKLIKKNFDGVEPVEGFWCGAVCDSFIVVAFAEAPETNLVKIVEAEGSCERVHELNGSTGGSGDDI
jgi:hypothetical protein